MKAGLDNTTNGYELTFKDLVDRDLKGSPVSPQEQEYLNTHKKMWKKELIRLKKQTETQFTSSRARVFSLYREVQTKKIDYTSYIESLHKEKVKRVNTVTFLAHIENKLQNLKAVDDEQ